MNNFTLLIILLIILLVYLLGLVFISMYFILEKKELFKGRTVIYDKYKYLYICGILFYPIFIVAGILLLSLFIIDATVDLINEQDKQ